jgi:WD40 repeat protein
MTAHRFQPGGTLREGSLYAEREADRELFGALRSGETCAVLAPRQIGKSSLRVRTARKLRAEGLRVATVDLTRIGGRHTDVSGWYFGLVQELASRLSIEEDPSTFWRRYENATPLHRFVLFLRERVLGDQGGPVVVFFDEIDSVLALPFAVDDFFAALRETYNARADDEAYRRLSICLMGVAAPGDLAREPARTPFNVGRSVRLEDFTRAEAAALLPGLRAIDPNEAERWLDAIYGWTSGHPYMMQKLCAAIAEGERDVEAAVDRLFLRHGRTEDPNLEYAERRLVADARATPMLRLYRRLLDGQRVPSDRDDPTQYALRLTGMAAEDRSGEQIVLAVRNRVYGLVFDGDWVRETETARLIAEPLLRWLEADQSDDFVLRGQALDDAQAWAKDRADLSADESRFLLAGLSVARREEAARAEAQREVERRKQAEAASASLRRNLTILSVLVVLLIGSLGVALFQYRAAKQSQAAAEAAARRERGVIAHALAAQIGQEIPAVVAGIDAVAPSVAMGEEPPSASVSGLGAALFAAEYSRRVELPAGAFNATDITPDGLRLVTAQNDRVLRTWSVPEEEAPPLILRAKLELGHAPRFEDDGSVIVVPDEKRVRAWTSDGREALSSAAVKGDLLDVARREGATRALVADGPSLSIVDVSGASPPRQLELREPVRTASFSPDGGRVCVPRAKDALLFEDGGSLLARLEGGDDEIRGCAFSPDGSFAVSSTASAVLVWSGDPRSVDEVAERWDEDDAANTDLQAVAVSSGGTHVAWSGRTTVVVVERTTRTVIRKHAAPFVTALAFSEDGRWLAGGRRDGRVEIVETRASGATWSFRAHSRMILSVAFSPDGRHLMTSSVDGTVRVFAIEPLQPEIIARTSTPITCLGVSSDGSRVVHGGAPGEVFVRSLPEGDEIARFPDQGELLARCRFSPDGRRVVLASGLTIREWSVDGARLERTIAAPATPADVTYSPDGRRIAASFVEGPVTLRIWDLASGAVVAEIPAPSRLPSTLRFAPDGRTLFVGGPDGNVAAVAAETGRIDRLLSSGATTSTVATSRDGSLVLATCADATAHVWDASSGEERVVLRGRTPLERPLRFTADGAHVHFRGVARPLPTTPRALLRRACALLAHEGELAPVEDACRPHLTAR